MLGRHSLNLIISASSEAVGGLQVLGNRGPLSRRDPGQVFATAARDCKTPEHGDDIEAVTAGIPA